MGVVNLYEFLKKHAPSAKSKTSLNKLKKGCVGLDATSYIHKAAKRFGSNSDKLAGMLLKYAARLLEFGIIPVFVFDGPETVPEKKKTREIRRKRNIDNEEKLNLISETFKLAEQCRNDYFLRKS